MEESVYPRPMNRDLFLILLGSTGVFVRYLFLQRPSELPETQAWLALVLLAICIAPLFLFLRGLGSGPLPLMPAIGIFYCLAFALPIFIDFTGVDLGMTSYSPPSESVIWLLLGAMAAFLGLYYWCRSLIRPSAALSIRAYGSGRKLNSILWAFAAAHIVDLYFHWTRAVLSLTALIEAASYLSFGYLLLEMFADKLPQGQKYSLLFIALPLELIADVTTGFIAQPLQLFQMIFFAHWLARRKIPWATIIIGVVALFALHDVKDQYRRLTWAEGGFSSASSWKKLRVFTELAMQPRERTVETAPLANSGTFRFSHLQFLDRVVEMTPDQIPYWEGETYKALLYKLIPRFFWPNKPSELLGLELSRRYGMRALNDETTSIDVPWIIEMYVNFGQIGTFVGMAIVGLMFAWMDRTFNRVNMLPLDRVIGVVMVGDLILQETNFSLMVGNKVLVYLSLTFIFQALLGTAKGRDLTSKALPKTAVFSASDC